MSAQEQAIQKPASAHGLILEAWSQGFMIGSLIIMAGVTVANMRRGVLLHKLILIELIFGMPHGTFIFPDPPAYGWYLSTTAIFLNLSWSLHNVVAWLKNKPFLSKRASLLYIGTVVLAQPYWVVEIYANWTYFNNINDLFHYTRPYEALFRDPWWIFTTINLFWNIKRRYEFGLVELIRVSPRFGILLGSMVLSISFLVLDVLAVTQSVGLGLPDGLNPFWKLSFVFKCFTDTIILDDFKTALDKLKQYKLDRMGSAICGDDLSNNKSGKRWSYATDSRRATYQGPSQERTGITPLDRVHGRLGSTGHVAENPPKVNHDNIDLEMNYWTTQSPSRGESSQSHWTTEDERTANSDEGQRRV